MQLSLVTGAAALVVGIVAWSPAAVSGPAPASAPPQAAPIMVGPSAIAVRNGKLVFRIKLVKKSPEIPNNVIPYCFVSATHWTNTRYYHEMGGEVSGSGECVITVPYNWPSADTGYGIALALWVQLNKDNWPGQTNTAQVPARYLYKTLDPIHLPADGATTTVRATADY